MLDSDKGVTLSIEFDDAAGFATTATPDQPPAWTEDQNGAFIKLTPAADGMTCVVTPVAPGNSNVSVAVSVGGKQFTGTLPVPVVAGAAVSVKINSTPLA